MIQDNPLALTLPESNELKLLPKYTEALSELSKLLEELVQIDDRARKMKLITRADFDAAKKDTERRKEIVKLAEEVVEPYKKPLRKWLDFVQQTYNVVKNRAEQIKGIADPKMDLWKREDDRKAAEEQRRIQAQIDEQNAQQAEDKRLADLKAAAERKREQLAELKRKRAKKEITQKEYAAGLKAIGEEALWAAEQADIEAEEKKNNPPKVEVEKTKTGGRTYYHGECADKRLFLTALLKAASSQALEDLMQFVTVDDSALDEKAREVKDSKKFALMFPGTRAWDETKF